ncbi:MAG: putative methyltransferase, partial [Nitrospinota bacterium]
LALALTRLPTRIVVLEVDERIGAFLCRCRQQYDLPIEYIPYNVTDPLPPELREQSDLFSTEPLETLSGFLTFFARGAATLRAGGVGYVGLTTLECSLKKWKRIQEAILRMGFVITEIQRRFSDYPMEYPEDRVYVEQVIKSVRFPIKPEGKVWYFSHLFRVEAIEEITPVIPPQASTRIDLFDPGDDLTYPEGQVTET